MRASGSVGEGRDDVADVDRLWERAVAGGCEVIYPLADQFYGDRSGTLTDPFGHVWTISTHKEDLTPEEICRRFEAWQQQQK